MMDACLDMFLGAWHGSSPMCVTPCRASAHRHSSRHAMPCPCHAMPITPCHASTNRHSACHAMPIATAHAHHAMPCFHQLPPLVAWGSAAMQCRSCSPMPESNPNHALSPTTQLTPVLVGWLGCPPPVQSGYPAPRSTAPALAPAVGFEQKQNLRHDASGTLPHAADGGMRTKHLCIADTAPWLP